MSSAILEFDCFWFKVVFNWEPKTEENIEFDCQSIESECTSKWDKDKQSYLRLCSSEN